MHTHELPEKPRWIYRFDNYKRAFHLLREGIEIGHERQLTQLEKEGLIQRFEYTWELAWKLIKDYLDAQGLVLDKITPASVIKAAFEAKIITDGDLWMAALDARNKMAHTYDFSQFEAVILAIQSHYLRLFEALHMDMLEAIVEERPNNA